MPVLSIAAARLAGVDRQTIRRAIQAGKLRVTASANGNKVIEISELLRVYQHASAQGTPGAHSGQVVTVRPRAAPGVRPSGNKRPTA